MSTSSSSDDGSEETIDVDDGGNTTNSRNNVGGAKRSSKVWDYFADDSSGTKAICQVKLAGGRSCNQKLVKNTTTLENHLKARHPSYFGSVQQAKRAKKESKRASTSSLVQSTITSFDQSRLNRREKYDSNHPKQIEFNRSITLLLASSSMAYQILDDPMFKETFAVADPKLSLPNRLAASKSVRELDSEMKTLIKSKLDASSHLISLSADIWSRRGLSSSFLGITAHFFDESTKAPRCLLLGMTKFEDRHTADNILSLLEATLSKYGLSAYDQKIFRIVTDNGSNIKKALDEVEQIFIELHEEVSEPTEATNDPAAFDTNLEVEDVEQPDVEAAEFENGESDHNSVFGFQKRLACIDHGLTCAIRMVVDKDPTVSSIKSAAFKLIRSMNMSLNAVKYLRTTYGKKLILPPSHRWVYTYYAFERLLELERGVKHLVDEIDTFEDNKLSGVQWRQVVALIHLLKPFADFVRDLEGEKYVTISRVLPDLLDLKAFLDEEAPKVLFGPVARALKDEIDRRFSYILNSNDPKFAPIYAVATLIDPKLTKLLDLPECFGLKDAAISHLRHLARFYGEEPRQPSSSTSQAGPNPAAIVESGVYARLFSRLEQSSTNERPEASDLEISHFLNSRGQLTAGKSDGLEGLLFWSSRRVIYPALFKVAIAVLCIPATSAAAERVFSQAGLCSSALRSRLSDQNLEAEVMVRVNKSLLK